MSLRMKLKAIMFKGIVILGIFLKFSAEFLSPVF